MAGFSRDTVSSQANNRPDIDYQWVNTDADLADFVEHSLSKDFYYLDTEFHREKTYFPQLALVQIAAGSRIAVIDPLCTNHELLRPLLEGDGICVLHAAQQDLDVLSQSWGFIPSHIIDTQLCAGFIGYSQPSLASLLQSFLRITVPKGDRLTDWLKRPLTTDQLSYAASDVAYLSSLLDHITDRLRTLGRLAWAEEACEELRQRPTGPNPPEDAWLRVKDVRTLKGKARWIARSVAAWREGRAMELNIPPRHVLSDIAILGISQRAPKTTDSLLQSRGVDHRHVSGPHGHELLEAVQQGVADSNSGELMFPTGDGEDLDKTMRPAITLVSAWVTELARQSELDAGLLGTRKDIIDLLAGAPHARLRTGWRAEIVGHDIEDLVAGRKALTFTPDHGGTGLKLVEVPLS